MSGRVGRALAPAARGVAAGLVGTSVMTGTLKLEQAVYHRAGIGGTVDYDASDHVVTAASAVLRDRPSTDRGDKALFLLVHWGYGSAVGIGFAGLLRAGQPYRRATMEFYALCQAMAMTLFPTLGDTPPPWRWPRRILLSSLAQHAVYAATVAGTTRAISAARTSATKGRRVG
jgi:hypothetical protein